MDILEKLAASNTEFEEYLYGLLENYDEKFPILFESCQYSLKAGGKRIRPFLVREFAKLYGCDDKRALSLAAAIEMIHTYSLIHDDLPCMDDDDLRRGKPSNHVVFGEATALLAGDALLTFAFEHIATSEGLSSKVKSDAIAILSSRAGIRGMIGGQQIDLAGEKTPHDFDTLIYMNELKTGALIEAACMLGVAAASDKCSDIDSAYAVAKKYAHGIGLAFQVIDDILDVCSTEEELGKPIHSDAENKKTTFMSFFDIDGAKAFALKLTDSAKEAVRDIPHSETLTALADYLQSRTN